MPFKLSPPTEKVFILKELDEEGEKDDPSTTVTIKQATQGEVQRRGQLFAHLERQFENESIIIRQHLSFDEIMAEEVFLTMIDCNILDENGKQLFKFKDGKLLDRQSFDKSWAKLPPLVANLIHKKVLEVNPEWTEVGEVSNAGESD